MRAARVTSLDVARLAGVSRATVSLVLSQSDRIALSPATRQRVLEAAATLGYTPNSAARMLVSGVSETIGLMVTDPSLLLHDGFIPQVLYGIQKANGETGFHILLEGMRTGGPRDAYDALVRSKRIDGLIVLDPRLQDEALVTLIESGFPVVLIGTIGHEAETSVTSPAGEAMVAAVDHLVGLGHRAFGTVAFAALDSAGARARVEALRAALAGHGLALDPDAVVAGDFTADSGHVGAHALFARRPDITAVFAGNDTIALGILSAAHEHGLAVPADLSLVGFDDLPFAGRLTPPLTTIRSDGVAQGIAAARMLFSRLGYGEGGPRQVEIAASLVLRQSTGPVRR